MINTLTQYVTMERGSHLVMWTFAAASVANIHSYFVLSGHDKIVAISMAIALGTAVATSATMLSMVDTKGQRFALYAIGAVAITFVALSGTIQTQSYIAHGLSAGMAAIMGYGLPLCGEALLAIACSLYRSSMRESRMIDAHSMVREKAIDALTGALSELDTGTMLKHMQASINKIGRYEADSLLAEWYDSEQSEPESTETEPESAKSNDIASHKPQADAVRLNGKREKMERVRAYFMKNPNAKQADAIRELGIPKSTMSEYVTELNGELKR